MTTTYDGPPVQTRLTCTEDEITTWQRQAAEAGRDWEVGTRFNGGEFIDDLLDGRQPSAIYQPAGPPCLGCGTITRPTPHLRDGVQLTRQDDRITAAVFIPCGCELHVYRPKILNHIPDGTYAHTGQTQIVTAELLALAVDLEAVLERGWSRLAHKLGERPHVQLLLDREQAEALRLPSLPREGDRLMAAIILRSRGTALPTIVFRPAANLPAGLLPAGYDGRRMEHPAVQMVRFSSRVFAVPTGEVEIDEHGQAAEVWEVRAEYEPTTLNLGGAG